MTLLQWLDEQLAAHKSGHPAVVAARNALAAARQQSTTDETGPDRAEALAIQLVPILAPLLAPVPALDAVIAAAEPIIGPAAKWLWFEAASARATPDDGVAVELPPNAPKG